MAVTAKQVQELRQATGAGMMDAKKALTESDGDFEAAVQILREKGLAKAAKRTDRDNAEGIVAVAENDAAVSLVHLKSETDFAAKSGDFVKMAQTLAELVAEKNEAAVSEKDSELEDLKLAIKENIEVGAVARFEKSEGTVSSYVHAGGTAAVLVQGEDVAEELLKEVAMHVVFAKPAYLSREEVPAEDIAKEKASLLEITKAEGKPEQAWDKIVEGRVNSWLSERVLLEQGLFGEKETVASKLGKGQIKKFVLASVGA